MRKKIKMVLGAFVICSVTSCSTVLDILVYMAETNNCCTAYRSNGCIIGEACSYEECQEMLVYSDDYCQCNCPD